MMNSSMEHWGTAPMQLSSGGSIRVAATLVASWFGAGGGSYSCSSSSGRHFVLRERGSVWVDAFYHRVNSLSVFLSWLFSETSRNFDYSPAGVGDVPAGDRFEGCFPPLSIHVCIEKEEDRTLPTRIIVVILLLGGAVRAVERRGS